MAVAVAVVVVVVVVAVAVVRVVLEEGEKEDDGKQNPPDWRACDGEEEKKKEEVFTGERKLCHCRPRQV